MASRTKASQQLSDFAAAKKVCGNVRYYLLISCLRICPGGIDAPNEKNIVRLLLCSTAFFPWPFFQVSKEKLSQIVT